MGLKDLQEMSKAANPYQRIKLKDPITIEDLHKLLTEKWNAEIPGKFELKKGLFGKSIRFDIYMKIRPVVTVKGNVVTVRKTESSTTVGGVDFKNMSQKKAAFKEGGVKKALMGGIEYYITVANTVKEILKDKMQTS